MVVVVAQSGPRSRRPRRLRMPRSASEDRTCSSALTELRSAERKGDGARRPARWLAPASSSSSTTLRRAMGVAKTPALPAARRGRRCR
eukprot:scaffold2707_cov417-Prasinococcus_capsulatus_cf.AAC.3